MEKLESLDEIRRKVPSEFIQKMDALGAETIALDSEKKFYLFLKGYAEALKGDTLKAEEFYLKSIQITGNDFFTLRAKLALANIYVLNSNYNQSLELLEDVLAEIKHYPISDVYPMMLTSALIYNEVGQYEIAESILNNIEASKYVSEENECLSYAVTVQYQAKLNKLDLSDNVVDNYIQTCENKNQIVFGNIIRAYKMAAFIEQERHQEANIELLANLNQVESGKYNNLISIFYSQIAESFFGMGEISKSIEFAKKAVETPLSGQRGQEWIVSAYKLLYLSHKKQSNIEVSLYYLEKYNDADKAYINDITAKQLAFQLAKHQAADKNRQIELLNKQNQVLTLEQDLAQQSANNNKLMILLLMTVLASLAFWSYRVKRNQMEFKRRSETDALTGVSSRYYFYSACRQVLKDAEQHKMEVSLILFDMDRFKSVNDKYGHLVGDWVLKKAIEVCRPCWRQNDIVGRLGGEEFALMLPTCDINKAVEIAENCRKAIEAVDTTDSGHTFNISASFGVTTSKVSGYDFSKLIGDSDKIMYQAKASGKNQVFQVASKS